MNMQSEVYNHSHGDAESLSKTQVLLSESMFGMNWLSE